MGSCKPWRIATCSEAYALAHPKKGPELEQLEGRLDSGTIEGPDPKRLNADLVAKAHLWLEGEDRATALQLEPVVATLRPAEWWIRRPLAAAGSAVSAGVGGTCASATQRQHRPSGAL